MLRPEYLEGLPDEILELFSEAEQEILTDMARRISTYDYWIPAADHQNQVLREAGIMQEDILSVLSATTRKSEEELRAMMQSAGSMALHNDESVYAAGGFRVPSIKDSLPLRNVLNAGYQATATEMRNLCRTTARTASKQFEDALDRAWLNVSSGAFDADAAIRSAIKELSEKGIQSITYPSGKTDSIETAVRRAVVTGVNQTAGQLQNELADELGCDLVEVTAHSDARPEHALWQGRIYSRSGKHPNYPPFVASTGYGTGEGLCGWNCRHSFGPYIEGSTPIYSQEELDKLNEPTVEVDGKKMTEYEARQRMRYNERQIRRWKREEVALNAAGLDSGEASAKVREWQARQRDFINQTGFKRRYGLEQISGASPKILPDSKPVANMRIGRSVGAKSKNYEIIDIETGEVYNFLEGSRLQDSTVFAGNGVKTPLRPEVAFGLAEEFGGKPSDWQHAKATADINYNGEIRRAEVHWFQAKGIGKVKFKVKRWLDED